MAAKLIIAIALTILLMQFTLGHVQQLLQPVGAYAILYYILSYTLINAYERSKKGQDQHTEKPDNIRARGSQADDNYSSRTDARRPD